MIADEVQRLFPADGGYSARIDIKSPPGAPELESLNIVSVDDTYIERESARIKKRFNEIFQ
jgi:iron(III) transport system substrate-binding protein